MAAQAFLIQQLGAGYEAPLGVHRSRPGRVDRFTSREKARPERQPRFVLGTVSGGLSRQARLGPRT